jgi:hypothetical protein
MLRSHRAYLGAILSVVSLAFALTVAEASGSEANPEWFIQKGAEKHVLKSKELEVFSPAITTTSNWAFEMIEGPGIIIECTKAGFFTGFFEGFIEGPSAIDASAIEFSGCKVTEPVNDRKCEIASTGYPNGVIRTQGIGFATKIALTGTTKAPKLRLEPGFNPEEVNKKEIVTVHMSGPKAECAESITFSINGILVANVDTAAARKAHKWEFTRTSGTLLSMGTLGATFLGSGEFTLKSGNEWGEL